MAAKTQYNQKYRNNFFLSARRIKNKLKYFDVRHWIQSFEIFERLEIKLNTYSL